MFKNIRFILLFSVLLIGVSALVADGSNVCYSEIDRSFNNSQKCDIYCKKFFEASSLNLSWINCTPIFDLKAKYCPEPVEDCVQSNKRETNIRLYVYKNSLLLLKDRKYTITNSYISDGSHTLIISPNDNHTSVIYSHNGIKVPSNLIDFIMDETQFYVTFRNCSLIALQCERCPQDVCVGVPRPVNMSTIEDYINKGYAKANMDIYVINTPTTQIAPTSPPTNINGYYNMGLYRGIIIGVVLVIIIEIITIGIYYLIKGMERSNMPLSETYTNHLGKSTDLESNIESMTFINNYSITTVDLCCQTDDISSGILSVHESIGYEPIFRNTRRLSIPVSEYIQEEQDK